tara:strand:- start:204 stop:995 length:792 start_codon:yes stop_codon:yes gene_type:complete
MPIDSPLDSLRTGSQLPHNQSDIVNTLRQILSLEAELREGEYDATREAEINKELEILREKYEEQQFEEATTTMLNDMNDVKNMNERVRIKAREYVKKLLKNLELDDFKDDFILKDLTPEEKDLIINEVGKQMRSYILNNLYDFIVKVFPNFPGLHSIKQMSDTHISFKNKAEEKIKNMKMNNDLKEIKSNILINNQLLKSLYQKIVQDSQSSPDDVSRGNVSGLIQKFSPEGGGKSKRRRKKTKRKNKSKKSKSKKYRRKKLN